MFDPIPNQETHRQYIVRFMTALYALAADSRQLPVMRDTYVSDVESDMKHRKVFTHTWVIQDPPDSPGPLVRQMLDLAANSRSLAIVDITEDDPRAEDVAERMHKDDDPNDFAVFRIRTLFEGPVLPTPLTLICYAGRGGAEYDNEHEVLYLIDVF